VPDMVTDEKIVQVNNIAYQALTKQVRYYVAISKEHNLTFELHTREDTIFSRAVQDAI
jgi:hypothetical protein